MMNERSSNSLEYALLWRNPGARISGSMYHEGNPGARISGSMYHEGTLGVQISYEYVFGFLPKNLEHGVCIMNPKSLKTQGKLSFAPFPGISRLHVFLAKTAKEEEKQSCLQHEFPWSPNFFSSSVCSGNPWGPNLFLCAGKILVRKPPRKTVASKPQQFVPSREQSRRIVFDCQCMLILLNPPNWFESCLIFKSNGKRYPLIVDNLYFVQNDKIAEVEHE